MEYGLKTLLCNISPGNKRCSIQYSAENSVCKKSPICCKSITLVIGKSIKVKKVEVDFICITSARPSGSTNRCRGNHYKAVANIFFTLYAFNGEFVPTVLEH